MTANDLKANLPVDDVGGDVIVCDLVIAKLAGHAARRTYGVVDMHRSAVSALMRFFRETLTEGVEVDVRDGQAWIALHVVMERGIKLAEVTATLEEQVRFEVERESGVRVAQVTVRVEDVRG